jgi:hypothetical protein
MLDLIAFLAQTAATPDITLPIAAPAIGGLSVAGVLAWYLKVQRDDINQERAANRSLTERAFAVVEANTTAVTKLTSAIEALTEREQVR